jgi:alkylation response protein AidB-like acyl-CoA dehydrogenase
VIGSAPTGTGFGDVERADIVSLARRLAQERIAPRALEIAHGDVYPEDVFALLRDHGFFGLLYPTTYAGLGAGLQTVCDVVEAIAEVCNTSSSLLISQVFGGLPILIAGDDEQRARYIPDIAAGSIRCAMAMTEPDAGSDPAGIRTLARRDGDDFVLDGRKCFISMANLADVITVYAKLEPGRSTRNIQGFLIAKETPGLRVGRIERKMGSNALPTCEVILEGCRVPASARLGQPGSGFRLAMQVFERVRPIIAARAVGLAQGAFDVAAAYLQEREAFGSPLAALQGLQFMVADMATGIEASRGLVRRACEAVAAGDPQAGRYCAMAKLFATDTAMRVTTDCVQLLGGYGYLSDHPVEHRMREAKLSQIVEGTNQIQRVVIARSFLRPARR